MKILIILLVLGILDLIILLILTKSFKKSLLLTIAIFLYAISAILCVIGLLGKSLMMLSEMVENSI